MAGQTDQALTDATIALDLSPADTELLIIRAAAQSTLGQYQQAIEDLDQALRLDGGMSANDVFVQALAEAVGRPIEVSATREATTLGAGFLAGLATGTWRDEDDVAATYRPGATVEPVSPEPVRAQRRTQWLEVRHRSEQLIPELSTITF